MELPLDQAASQPSNPLFNQSLEKGLTVLGAFSNRQRTMTIAEIAQASCISKSSAQRMVYTLEKLGYLCRHRQTGRYQLSVRALRLGFNYLAANALIDIANPFLSELANTTGETVCLTEPDETEMVYVARFISGKFVPVHMPIGCRIPMYCTSSGRAYLSALPPHDAMRLLQASDRIKHTRHTQTELPQLEKLLEDTRRYGYATNKEELFLGDMTLGVPIISSQGRPIAAVHIVAPTGRWTMEEAENKLAATLIACARSLSLAVRAMD